MLHKPGWFGVFTLLVVTNVWSDEPPRGQGAVKQRVSPKVLREALALPEYHGQPSETPKVSLDDLQRLCEKLKKNGDNDGAELLQKFIHEHQQLTKLSATHSALEEQSFVINLEVLEVNIDDLPRDSILCNTDLTRSPIEARAELDRLIGEKKVKKIVDCVSREIMVNEVAKYHSGGEFQIHLPRGDGTKESEFRKFGTEIELQPTISTKGKVQLQVTCETADKDFENAITVFGRTVPGISKRKFQSTMEVSLGQEAVHSSPPAKGQRLFIMTKVTPKY